MGGQRSSRCAGQHAAVGRVGALRLDILKAGMPPEAFLIAGGLTALSYLQLLEPLDFV